jgi:hypothetical protein
MLKKILSTITFLFAITAFGQDFNWLDDLDPTDQIDTCEATLAVDNTTGQIGSMNHTLVICPDDPTLISTIDFTVFTIPGGNLTQQFTIYDGDSTAAPVLYDSPGTLPNGGFISGSDDNPSGCITIRYQSGFVPPAFTAGFEAIIDCREPCQDITVILESIEAENICSEPGDTTTIFPINEPITFNGDATTSNGTLNEDLTFTWEIDWPNNQTTTLFGESPEGTFDVSGTYEVTLTITDEFFCSSVDLITNFIIGTNEMNVSVQDADFTLQELIEDIMVGGGGCANVDNISSPVSSPSGSSIGYFSRGCSDFPFNEGIVLGSGGVEEVVGGFGANNWS